MTKIESICMLAVASEFIDVEEAMAIMDSCKFAQTDVLDNEVSNFVEEFSQERGDMVIKLMEGI